MSEQITISFDATELDNFEACQFKWHAYHHMNLRPKTTKVYFEQGNLIHYLLELYYKERIKGEVSLDSLELIVEAARVKSLEYDLTLEDVGEHIFQFREYVRFYEDENIIPIYIEQPFTSQIYEDDKIKVLISGKPDLIFKYSGSDDLIVMDHKRVTRDSEMSPLRNQFQLYATALETDTVIINKIGFQKTYKPKDRFKRVPLIYPKEILEEWKSDVVNRAKEILISETFDIYSRNRTSCEKWDGCYLARYCKTRPSARQFLIGSEYVIGDSWDVGKKLE